MNRTFKYRLYPTNDQETTFLSWLDHCRNLYNAALQQRIEAYKRQNKSVSRYDQHKDLTQLRQSEPSWSTVPVLVLRSALQRIDEAFQGFFRRIKRGSKPGFPRFRGYGWYDSFSLGKTTLVNDRHVKIPKLGNVKLNLYRPVQGEVRNTTIRFDGLKWWICFSCKLPDVGKKLIRSSTGIDLGLTSFATLTDGSEIDNPRFFRQSEEVLAQRQRKLARKKMGSKSRHRAKLLVRKIHGKIKNQRLDFSRKLAVKLFETYDLIVYEKLQIQNMSRSNNHGLNKSIQDASWRTFTDCLTYKAESAGRHAIGVNPRGTSQKCSGCGKTVKKTLSERIHRCPHCGLVLGRDHNAAINIFRLGQSLVQSAMITEASL